jgi:hypothetical protein
MMKKMAILILLIILSLRAYSPDLRVILVCKDAPIEPYRAIWEAICTVESGNDPLAIGDKNLKKHSYGIAQIREDRLKDFNESTGKHYTKEDMFDVAKSKEVFLYYAYGNNESIARRWNGGEDAMNPKKLKYTDKYYKLIRKHL